MISPIKHIADRTYVGLCYLFMGLHKADVAAFGNDSTNDSSGGAIEVHDERDSVYKAMLRGELTQEVKELRHEMYHAERESHNYEYVGGGVGKHRKNNYLFSGNIGGIDTEGEKVLVVQQNYEDKGGLFDAYDPENPQNKTKREFKIKIRRDILPKHRIEEFTEQLIVKETEDKRKIAELYVSSVPSEFNRRHRMFTNAMKAVYDGDSRSDILDIRDISFYAERAYGLPDLVKKGYTVDRYLETLKYGDKYVVRFSVTEVEDHDVLDSMFEKEAARKIAEKAPREGATYSFTTAMQQDDYDVDEANRLIAQLDEIDEDS